MLSTTAKNTILKAIHNSVQSCAWSYPAVNDSEKYNFESNSQQLINIYIMNISCQRQRKIQFWKQFTTTKEGLEMWGLLSTTAKNTILKAIHNETNLRPYPKLAVNDSEKYNFESNSQPGKDGTERFIAVNDSEKYNFESNSQRNIFHLTINGSCQRQRKIQFWKQFTTCYLHC